MFSIPYAALWIFIFSLPWQGMIRIGQVAVVSRALGGLALLSALLAVVINGRFRRWKVFHVAALLFVIWSGFLVFYWGLPQIPLKFWTFVQLFAVLWMIWELAPSAARLRGLLTAYVLGTYVSAIMTVLLLRQGSAMRRFSAGGLDPNDLAMMLALALPMAWYLSITTPRPLLRWIARGYVPIGLLAIILSGSRGGMVTGLVGLLVIPLTMTNLSPRRLVGAVTLLALAGVLAVNYVPENIVQRLETTGSEVEDARLGGRFKLWLAGLNAFMKQPVMGYGTSGFIPAVKPVLGPMAQTAHNSYLSVLVEEGLVGFLLYGTMIASVWLGVFRMPLLERRFGVALLLTLAMAMMPLTWEDVKAVWFTLAVLAGFAQAYGNWPGRALEPSQVPQFSPPVWQRAAARQQAGVARIRDVNRNTAR